MGITRRDFTALGGITVLVSFAGCGGDDEQGDFVIGGNHAAGPHDIFLPASDLAADLASQQPKTYLIQGEAQHHHFVTFSAEQLQQLKAGQRILNFTTPSSDGDLHDHQVTVFAPAQG